MVSKIVPNNPIAKLMWEDKLKFIIAASDSSASVRNNRRLPEALFKQHFLPFFAGDVPMDKRDEMLTIWIDVAGDVFSCVDIIGESGKTVVTIPSIGDRSMVPVITSDEQERMDSVSRTAAQKITISPVLSDRIMVSALEDRFVTDKPNPNLNAKRAQWEAVLNHYGRSLKEKSNVSVTGVSNGTHNVTDDDFE